MFVYDSRSMTRRWPCTSWTGLRRGASREVDMTHRLGAALLGLALLVAACAPAARPADGGPPGRAAVAPAEVAPPPATAAAPSLRPTEAPLDPPALVRAGLVGAVPNAGIY